MSTERELTDEQTREHILRWLAEPSGLWSWPTDGCGYNQHMRFVRHRNEKWVGGVPQQWIDFVTEYAESLVTKEQS